MILLLCITLILSLSHRIYWWVRIFETSLYPIYTFIHLAPIVPYVPTQCVCPCITITWICLGKLIKFSFFQLSSQFLTNQHCDWWSIRSYLRHEIVEYKRDWPGQLQLLHQCGIQVLLGGQQSSDRYIINQPPSAASDHAQCTLCTPPRAAVYNAFYSWNIDRFTQTFSRALSLVVVVRSSAFLGCRSAKEERSSHSTFVTSTIQWQN